jgi:hypothetical protein
MEYCLKWVRLHLGSVFTCVRCLKNCIFLTVIHNLREKCKLQLRHLEYVLVTKFYMHAICNMRDI